ncbi:MAG: hypothetical protein M3Q27_05030 [Actinomycetota bacterium]|nr:hypothetical protein [Actinomycetota bacterium]
MATLAVSAHVLGLHDVHAGERVDQRGLPGARRTEDHQRAPGPQQRAQDFGTHPALHGDRDAGGGRLGLLAEQVAVADQVGLGERDDRLCAARPGKGDEPLDPAETGLGLERVHDEDDVNVGGEHLAV